MNSGKKQKTADLMTMCIKAGRVVKGFDSSKEAVEGGKAFAVLAADDASECFWIPLRDLHPEEFGLLSIRHAVERFFASNR